MRKQYLKIGAELLGLQLFFSLLSMLFVEFFSWINSWEIIYSIFTGWLMLGAMHSTLWQRGHKDYKNNVIINNNLLPGQANVKLNIWAGAKYASLFFGVNVLVVLLTMFFDKGYGFGNVLYLVHRLLLAPLAGFLPQTQSSLYWPLSLLLCVVMYIPCITAYISGTKNFSLTELIVPKIIYKNTNKKTDDK